MADELRRIQIGLRVNFPIGDVVDFITRPDVLELWLPSADELGAQQREHVIAQLGAARGTNAAGAPEAARGVWLLPRLDGSGPGIALRLTARAASSRRPSGSNIRVVHVLPEVELEATLAAWQAATDRLAHRFAGPDRQRRRVRQAIVVVHGIGEQQPGQTLREFCEAVFPDDWRRRPYVRPDYVSDLFELRTVSLAARDGRPTTDVYELYWAHLVSDTTAAQVYGWAGRLLLAGPGKLPRSLRVHVWTIRALLVVAAVTAVALVATGGWAIAAAVAGTIAILPLLAWAISRVARHYLLHFAGDAARYLEPRPGNIRTRQTIREEGVRLLERLHDLRRYDRIILYGHSLGSVIAYDIVCRTWARRYRKRTSDPDRVTSKQLAALERAVDAGPRASPRSARDIQPLQYDAWCEYRRNGFDWLVSDLVTVGSPLAHANWLLNADRRTTFETLLADHTFCSSPPQTEQVTLRSGAAAVPPRRRFTYTHSYRSGDGTSARSVLVPHHAGVFAITRWTNLYFPHGGALRGDPVGGPVQPAFGCWVDDRELEHPGGGAFGFAHTRYLSGRGAKDRSAGAQSPADAVRLALSLQHPLSLRDLDARAIAAEAARSAAGERDSATGAPGY